MNAAGIFLWIGKLSCDCTDTFAVSHFMYAKTTRDIAYATYQGEVLLARAYINVCNTAFQCRCLMYICVFYKASVQFQSRSEFYRLCCFSESKAVRSSICSEGQSRGCLLGRLQQSFWMCLQFKVQRSEVKFTLESNCLYCFVIWSPTVVGRMPSLDA